MENSKIEWTDSTFNPFIGCQKVSPGCQHCYAETLMDTRYGRVKWGPQGTRVRTSAENWRKPLAWNRQEWWECRDCGYRGNVHSFDDYCPVCRKSNCSPTRQRVFCASLADVFEDRPELEEWRDDLWELIHSTPNLDWLLLTKRPENVVRMMNPAPTEKVPAPYLAGGDYLPNVWLGTSIENQEVADKRIPELLKIPARVRFLSVEPLLDRIDLKFGITNLDDVADYLDVPEWKGQRIDWVIVGGESGPHARPMHPDWARSIRDQCQAAGVPFHFKQWGEYVGGEIQRNNDFVGGQAIDCSANGYGGLTAHSGFMPVLRVGKKRAGRLLDGREWSEFPDVLNA